MTTDTQVCVAGLGGMGGAMARRLHNRDYEVIGVDPDQGRREDWALDTGRVAVEGVSQVQWSDVTHLVIAVRTEAQALAVLAVSSSHAVDDLGLIVISTLPVGFWSRTRDEVPPQWRVFEAPVTGGEEQARVGEVAMFLHGNGTPADHALLSDLSNRIVDFDVHGQPALAKLLNNTLTATNAMNVTRALHLAHNMGLASEVFLAALEQGSGRSLISSRITQLSPNQFDLLEKDVGLLHAELPDADLGVGVVGLAASVRDSLGDLYDPDSHF